MCLVAATTTILIINVGLKVVPINTRLPLVILKKGMLLFSSVMGAAGNGGPITYLLNPDLFLGAPYPHKESPQLLSLENIID